MTTNLSDQDIINLVIPRWVQLFNRAYYVAFEPYRIVEDIDIELDERSIEPNPDLISLDLGDPR